MFLTAFFYALIMSFILGIVHGITPDEHTWPITFSYAVGSGTVEGGAKAGLVFSAGFTLQRALMSEIAYFVFVGFMLNPFFSGVVYIIVGAAMVFAGSYILNKGIYPHWHWLEEKLGVISTLHSKDSEYHTRELEHSANPVCCEEGGALKAAPTSMAFIHGIIAGFGFGAFALILFTSISPAMPSPWVAWLPGLLFGVGTMLTQVLIGSGLVVFLTRIKNLSKEGVNYVTRFMSGNTLYYGGALFSLAGILIILFPAIAGYGIKTPINIPNLDEIDLGFILVIAVVAVIGVGSYFAGVKKAEKLGLIKNESKKKGFEKQNKKGKAKRYV